MTPKEKGQFLLKYFKNERGSLDLTDVDLSDFKGNVIINGWKVGGNLYQDKQEAKDECKLVEPDYKSDYEKIKKEFYEVYRQKEALLWALGKAMEESK